MAKIEVYVSTDVEATGPIPGVYSMLNLGSVAYDAEGKEIGEFNANLKELEGAIWDPGSREFWNKQDPAVVADVMRDPEDPAIVMERYAVWLESFKIRPVFVGYPAGFDFTHVYWYLMKFAKRSPYSWSALDIKTMAFTMGMAKTYSECSKGKMPKEWTNGLPPHTHRAIDDAREQGVLFFRILNECRNGSSAGMSPDRKMDRIEKKMDAVIDGLAAALRTARKTR